MAITEAAKAYHEKMFPNYESKFWKTIQSLSNVLITLPLMKW